MLKPIISALLLSTAASAAAAVPDTSASPTEVAATEISETEKAAKEMDEMMSIFGQMFDTSNLPPPEPARLELATITAARLLPDGAYVKIMDDMLSNMLTPLLNIQPGLTEPQIVSATGLSDEEVAALTDEKKAVVTAMIDPQHKERGTQILEIIKPLIAEAMMTIEPAMRNGLSRAYARKFSAEQLRTINGFFVTPTGAAFARESFAIQADPEVMQATFKALPAMFTRLIGEGAGFKEKFEALPKQRELKDLSEAEMQQLAAALGVAVKSLEDHRTLASAVDPYAQEKGDEPWYAENNWAAAERRTVKALEAKSAAATARSEEASDRATAAYELYEQAWQIAVNEARKRLLAEGWIAPADTTDDSDDAAGAVEAVAAL